MTEIAIEEILNVIDNILRPTRLNTIQEVVLRECWLGKTYQEIAADAGYDPDYIRVVGSRLWQMLSNALDEKVTKNNFRTIFRQQVRNGKNAIDGNLELPDGQVPLNSSFYIDRPPNETLAYETVLQPGALIRIKAPLQMGKTSLTARIIACAQAQEYHTVRLNFQLAEAAVLSDLNKLLRWLLTNITLQLHLKSNLDEYWDEDLGSKVSSTTYLQGYILEQLTQPLVIAFDEVDRLFAYSTTVEEFLSLLRFWHEESNNSEIWQNLRLIVVHSTDIYLSLNINQSPFNVGRAIALSEFTLEQVEKLAHRYQLPSVNLQKNLVALRNMVGGHPYLVRLAFHTLATEKITFEQLLAQAPTQTGIYREPLQRHLVMLKEYPELAAAVKTIIDANGYIKLPAIVAHKLESIGLVHLRDNEATLSCELYRLYFQDRLNEIVVSD